MSAAAALRPEVRQYIDRLMEYTVVAVGHTTDLLSLGAGPREPAHGVVREVKPFAAGRYKVAFRKGDAERAILVQTEEKVGHYVTVVPGQTDIGGYVQIFNDPSAEVPEGYRLTGAEVDYLVRGIYRKLRGGVDRGECEQLNRLKDMLLAILFSGKAGMEDYQRTLLER